MLLYPHNRVKTSAGARTALPLWVTALGSLKFCSTIMSLLFNLWSRRIALHFKKVKHSDLCQEELKGKIMSLWRNMQSHTADPLKDSLYIEQIRTVCWLTSSITSVSTTADHFSKHWCGECFNNYATVCFKFTVWGNHCKQCVLFFSKVCCFTQQCVTYN